MHSQLIAALFLAHKAVTALDIAPLNDLAGALPTATTDSPPDAGPCNTAYSVINYCYTSITDFNSAPAATIAACICCESTEELDSVYSSCAATLTKYAPERTQDYTGMAELPAPQLPCIFANPSTVNSQAASFCSAEFAVSGDICAGMTGTRTAPATTSATPTTSVADYPPTTVDTYSTDQSTAEDTSCSTETTSQSAYPTSAGASYPADTVSQDVYPTNTVASYPADTASQDVYPTSTEDSYPYLTETASEVPYPNGGEGGYPVGTGTSPGGEGYPTGTAGASVSSPAVVVSGAVSVVGSPLSLGASLMCLILSLYVLA